MHKPKSLNPLHWRENIHIADLASKNATRQYLHRVRPQHCHLRKVTRPGRLRVAGRVPIG